MKSSILWFMRRQKKSKSRSKAVYHLRNWSEYEQSLKKRHSLTLWLSEDVKQMWKYSGAKQRGAQYEYSDQAIVAMLTLKELFRLSNRGVEGFVRSLVELLGLDLSVPDHSTLCVRGKTLAVDLPRRANGRLHVVADSTGLKVYGEGEWKMRKHGKSQRRTWRKLHLMVNVADGEVLALELTPAGGHDSDSVAALLDQVDQPIESFIGDGGYDTRKAYRAIQARAPDAQILVPPQRNAHIWQHGNRLAPLVPRDQNLRSIRKYGRKAWKQRSGYHRRSLAETAMYRFKTLFGDHLSNRLMTTQTTQVKIRTRALNIMTHLGMPDSFRIG